MQKLDWQEFAKQEFLLRKYGLAIPRALFLRAGADRKATLGITEWFRPIVRIDDGVCFIDVGSSYPGRAQAAKGAGANRLKGIVSWVKNEVTQFG